MSGGRPARVAAVDRPARGGGDRLRSGDRVAVAVQLGGAGVLLAISLALLAAGGPVFNRRDIGV